MQRLYVPDDLREGSRIVLRDKAHHYICHVLRYKINDCLHVFNGRQGEFMATLASISKKECVLTVVSLVRASMVLPSLALYAPPLRPARMAYLFEKITELGVTDYHPIQTDHTSFPLGNLDKIERHFIESAEQCERLCVPTLHPIQPLHSVLATLNKPLLWACERSEQSQATALKQQHALLIGPEGGFSNAEKQALKAHAFVHEISLGPHVLRAETAAIAGLFLIGFSHYQ